MKTKLLLLAFLLCACLQASAQTPDSVFYRHSLGVTINPIYDDVFISKHPVAYGMIYRYQYKANKALRVGVSGAYETRTYLTTLKDHPSPKDSLFTTKFIELSLGHEWQHQINSSISIGYGIDFTPFLIHQLNNIDNILIGKNIFINEKIKRKYETIGLALQPLINIKIALTPRLYFIAECKATIEYAKEKYTATGTYGDINESPQDRGTISGGAERERVASKIKPISSLQLNFRL
jgi:hypothetical protein